MPRRARIIIPGQPYHITHRGNHRAPILCSDDERQLYTSIMLRWQERMGIRVACFALLNNHVHYVASSPTSDALSAWIRNGHREYSKWYNTIRNQGGCNWEGRFYSVLMDPEHCLNALRYVEQNPVRGKLCAEPWNWRWSSAAWHSGLGPRPSILNADFRPDGIDAASWRTALTTPTSAEFRARLSECLRLGTPLASAEWINEMEAKTGLKLTRSPKGRPRTELLVPAGASGPF